MRHRAVIAAAIAVAVVGAVGLVSNAVGASPSHGSLGNYKHLVVIYEENHSFDNLYGLWGKVGHQKVDGLPDAEAGTTQVDQSGAPINCHFDSSAPFSINDYVNPPDKTCAPPTKFAANGVENGDPQGLPGGCTRDIVHRFYQEQYQLDGGIQDRDTTGSDAAGLTMGHYDTTQLPVYKYLHGAGAPNYVIADDFFQGAFGGSFLSHQYLIAAQA